MSYLNVMLAAMFTEKMSKMNYNHSRFIQLSKESRNKLFAIWMSKERLEGSKTLDLMLALDDEWQRVYDFNRKDGFSAARLLANENLLALIYGC